MQPDPWSIEFLVCFVADDSSRCARTESERTRQKIQEGVRSRIYSRIIILPVIAWDSLKELTILRNSTEDMAQVPLIGTEENGSTESSIRNMVILEVKKIKKKKKNKRKKFPIPFTVSWIVWIEWRMNSGVFTFSTLTYPFINILSIYFSNRLSNGILIWIA